MCGKGENAARSIHPPDDGAVAVGAAAVAQRRMGGPHRGRSNDAPASERWSLAVDDVPPVLALEAGMGGWTEAAVVYRNSLQHLGTLVTASTPEATEALVATVATISATPILVQDYLVAATQKGTISVWHLNSLPALDLSTSVTSTHSNVALDTLSPTVPMASYDTAAVPIVQLTVGPSSLIEPIPPHAHNASNALEVFIVAVNAVGTIYVLGLHNDTVPSSPPGPETPSASTNQPGTVQCTTVSGEPVEPTSTAAQQTVRLVLVAEWNTGRMGVTSLAIVSSQTYHTSVLVGYASGHVEAWSFREVNAATAQSIPPPVSPRTPRPSRPTSTVATVPPLPPPNVPDTPAHLQWRANFTDMGPPPSVAAMAQLTPWRGLRMDTPTASEPTHDAHDFLTVTLHHEAAARPRTSAMVQVVNVTMIRRAWTALATATPDRAPHAAQDVDDTVHARAVSMHDYSVPPTAGRDIVDAATIPVSRRTAHDDAPFTVRPNWIPSLGTNSVCPMQSGSNVATGLADGMVVILESSLVPVESASGTFPSQLEWGVSKVVDQLCLSYPCIGMGCIDVTDEDGSPVPHVVCCLRGSATYVIPFQEIDANATTTVRAVSVPPDGDEPTSIPRHLQRFAAFNLVRRTQLNRLNDDAQSSLPILIYVWPGGSIDVFSYGLLPSPIATSQSSRSNLLLDELVSNGAAELLRSALLSLPCEDDRLSKDWETAKYEIKLRTETAIQRQELDSGDLRAFRSILLALSEREPRVCS